MTLSLGSFVVQQQVTEMPPPESCLEFPSLRFLFHHLQSPPAVTSAFWFSILQVASNPGLSPFLYTQMLHTHRYTATGPMEATKFTADLQDTRDLSLQYTQLKREQTYAHLSSYGVTMWFGFSLFSSSLNPESTFIFNTSWFQCQLKLLIKVTSSADLCVKRWPSERDFWTSIIEKGQTPPFYAFNPPLFYSKHRSLPNSTHILHACMASLLIRMQT